MPEIFETYAADPESGYVPGPIDLDRDTVLAEARQLAELVAAEDADWN